MGNLYRKWVKIILLHQSDIGQVEIYRLNDMYSQYFLMGKTGHSMNTFFVHLIWIIMVIVISENFCWLDVSYTYIQTYMYTYILIYIYIYGKIISLWKIEKRHLSWINSSIWIMVPNIRSSIRIDLHCIYVCLVVQNIEYFEI